MPAVRVERLPVKALGLGHLGFDHLHIVFRGDFGRVEQGAQDSWFVIEGLREPGAAGPHLAVEGWHGGTTLSEANGGLVGDALVASIGTSETRGDRDIAQGGDAVALWATLSSFAADIESQKFPYIAAALPASALPTLNSSSLVASLLHHAGLDIETALPSALRFSPGTSTLLGTSRDDDLSTGNGFKTLVAGNGNDTLSGSDTAIEKFYGGRGNDTLHWSGGINIMHGGQPGLPYQDDGIDTVDYTGASAVRIEAPVSGEAHSQPDFVVTHSDGQDRLFSIEEILWDGARDHLSIGKGVGLSPASLKVDLRGAGGADRATDERAGVLDFSQADAGFDITYDDRGALALVRRPEADHVGGSFTVAGVGRVVGSPFADRFILSEPGQPLTIDDAAADDRLIVTWRPARAELSLDVHRPHDAVIRLFPEGHASGSADIVLHNFRDGALGLDLTRSALALAPTDAGAMLISPELSASSRAPEPGDTALEADLSAFDLFSTDLAFADDLDDTLLQDFSGLEDFTGAAMLSFFSAPASG